jgi:hypothetical protein
MFVLTHIELPAFHVLASLFARDDYDKFGYLAAVHPFFQLGHDLFDVRLDLVVGGNCRR